MTSVRPPLLDAAQAERLLAEVIYARVRCVVDLEALYATEVLLVDDLVAVGLATADASARASALIDAALVRLVREPRRSVGELACGTCAACLVDDATAAAGHVVARHGQRTQGPPG
ncbi:MAG: hypothetical protein NT062_32550 [Proteobacteria bacterium]|nr:hypothetical protein [Pseudomonadota bacterium]